MNYVSVAGRSLLASRREAHYQLRIILTCGGAMTVEIITNYTDMILLTLYEFFVYKTLRDVDDNSELVRENWTISLSIDNDFGDF
ncbi:hypothetical protein IQ229_04905 [Nostoc cf. edaphicum LEGE 07299]|uniref:Uncharacterized protein n=1 Tax=Nostoc cf. edaphicum LEGE 07299 TaxID=2777974 RepID=A0ABR9TV72_9NOSO|nr:hypothetical protein [Nostoc edaphicum]MBE9104302.1 hypothetical protein [Nostoc cf. edaphicum LEGE 07299]